MNEHKERYINPLTGFGFKKLFEEEAYEESLKYYRDIKNVVDTSRQEGFNDGIETTAKKMKIEGFTNEQIKKITGLTDNEIENL